ncbi:MAG: DUF1868 domain-containing protein [Microcoleus anatoxicus]|uniref:DUF1868 domain-containing protein n=1 Tax=Microcoleus anatoxicus TaxID=2705319 RepID=UPI00366DCE28
MDDTYQAYVNRVARLTLLDSYKSQVEHIQESPKFKLDETGVKVAVPFPGYSVITPPAGEDGENAALYENLHSCQQRLLQELHPGSLIPLPPDSFHVTVADLIWSSAFQDASDKNPEFELQLRSRMADGFEVAKPVQAGGTSIRWIVLGFMVMTRAIGVCVAPTDENSYKQILELRRSIYQNPDLIGLGIEQQYHFTAHITLGYFGDTGPNLDRDRLCALLSELNDRWLDTPQELSVHRAELRKFDDMNRYYREPDWPVFEF